MERIKKSIFILFITIFIFSAVGFGFGPAPMAISKAVKDVSSDKGKDCYIIGKFPMVHIMDQAVADPEIAADSQDENSGAQFSIRIELKNIDNNKNYAFSLKPIPGSSQVYYRNEKVLSDNMNDLYWVLKVPAGNYELGNFICSLTLRMQGYQDFKAPVIDVPVSKVIKRTISFTTQPKQIVYIGDFNTDFVTYICLYRPKSFIYTFRNIQINLTNNFDNAKNAFLNAADDKTKEKLNDYEFISIIE